MTTNAAGEFNLPAETVIFKAASSTLKDTLKQVAWDFDGTGQVGGEGEHVVRTDGRIAIDAVRWVWLGE